MGRVSGICEELDTGVDIDVDVTTDEGRGISDVGMETQSRLSSYTKQNIARPASEDWTEIGQNARC